MKKFNSYEYNETIKNEPLPEYVKPLAIWSVIVFIMSCGLLAYVVVNNHIEHREQQKQSLSNITALDYDMFDMDHATDIAYGESESPDKIIIGFGSKISMDDYVTFTDFSIMHSYVIIDKDCLETADLLKIKADSNVVNGIKLIENDADYVIDIELEPINASTSTCEKDELIITVKRTSV